MCMCMCMCMCVGVCVRVCVRWRVSVDQASTSLDRPCTCTLPDVHSHLNLKGLLGNRVYGKHVTYEWQAGIPRREGRHDLPGVGFDTKAGTEPGTLDSARKAMMPSIARRPLLISARSFVDFHSSDLPFWKPKGSKRSKGIG